VGATIAHGTIATFDTTEACSMPGVLTVLTHLNAPRLDKAAVFPLGASGSRRPPLQDEQVRYRGQHVAAVIAESLETARHAASRVRVTYRETPPAATSTAFPCPPEVLEDDLARLSAALRTTGARRLLLVGDLIHSLRGLTPEVVERVAAWRTGHDVEMVLVRGNHDRHLDALPGAWRMSLVEPTPSPPRGATSGRATSTPPCD
jgi:hypothetical protein